MKTTSEAEAKEFREIGKLIGFGVWKHSYRISNPTATAEERSKAWEEVRETQIKAGRKALKALKDAGFTVAKA